MASSCPRFPLTDPIGALLAAVAAFDCAAAAFKRAGLVSYTRVRARMADLVPDEVETIERTDDPVCVLFIAAYTFGLITADQLLGATIAYHHYWLSVGFGQSPWGPRRCR